MGEDGTGQRSGLAAGEVFSVLSAVAGRAKWLEEVGKIKGVVTETCRKLKQAIGRG